MTEHTTTTRRRGRPSVKTPARFSVLIPALLALLAGTAAAAQDGAGGGDEPVDVFAPTPPPPTDGEAGGGSVVVTDGVISVSDEQMGPRIEQVTQLMVQAEGLTPALRMGVRAHVLREAQVVANRVVIVDSPEAAMEAIRGWTTLLRYPVLIDDGSVEAGENIARFVRAFGPEKVVRWSSADASAWPTDAEGRATRALALIGESLGSEQTIANLPQMVRAFRDTGLGPNGAVVIDMEDSAWAAGLALALGRLQPFVFMKATGGVNGQMSGDDMRGLADSIQLQLERIGLEWADLGDDVDAVTLAGNLALRVGLGVDGKDEKALTDLVGRHRAGIGNRWAWSGSLFGNAQTSMYRAMCGLFLPTESVWMFDGYGRGDPWDLYDATTAARYYENTDMSTVVLDSPANRVADWRRAVAPGLDAGLVLINSKGTVGVFNLGDGPAYPGDIPLLDIPTAVHIVHSWSARVPGSTRSVAGRWLHNGAYLYYGSIDEPYLTAFVRTPFVANRLIGGMPFGAAVRVDDGPPWKLNVLGDPLVTFIPNSSAGQRIPGELPLEGMTDLREAAAEALRGGNFAGGLRMLVLSGRDGDAARLARALAAERPESFGNAAAREAIMPLYRADSFAALASAYTMLSPDDQKNVLFQDALWHSGRILLAAGPNTVIEGLMRRNLRAGQEHHDAIEVARFVADRAGAAEAASFLQGVMPQITNDRSRQTVSDAARMYGAGRRP